MVEFITHDGIAVDVAPNQDLALTVENPFLTSERMPVAWTTDVELPASPSNCRLFGLPNAMLLPPRDREINVEMRIDGIPVMTGKLKLIGPTTSQIHASFQGVEIEDSLSGSLTGVALDKWNFGKLGEFDDKSLYNEVMSGAANGTRDDFATPCMIRSSQEDLEEPYIDIQSSSTRESWATKFVNAKVGTFTIPVVRLKYLLLRALPDYEIDPELEAYVENIGVVAPYRKNGNLADYATGCLDKDDDGNYIIDLAQAMPDIAIADFVKELLNAFCATICIAFGSKRMFSNKSILESDDFQDWTSKISDDFEQEYEDRQYYEYGFSGITDTNISGPIVDVDTVNTAFALDAGTVVHAKDTNDTYSVFEKSIRLGLSNGESTGWTIKALKVLKQGGMGTSTPDSGTTETVSATSALLPVKTIPYEFPTYISWAIKGSSRLMIPVVDIPDTGGTRPSNVYLGIFEQAVVSPEYAPLIQLTGNGCYGDGGGLLSVFMPGNQNLSVDGERGLAQFHRQYKEWVSKEKIITKTAVNLSAADIANLRVWQKIMIYNQLFFIRTLTITLNTSKNYIHSEAELVTA